MDDNKQSDAQPNSIQIQPPAGVKGCETNSPNYYTTSEVAKILNVDRSTVVYWRSKGLFEADIKRHHVFLYTRERVEQLKAVTTKIGF